METATIERVFGGITYLLGAFSKYDFFSHLEAFLAEVFGSPVFSVIAVTERPDTFRRPPRPEPQLSLL